MITKLRTHKLVKLTIGLLLVFVLPMHALAKDAEVEAKPIVDPSGLMKVAIENVLEQLKKHEALYQSDPEKLRTLVADTALPNLNIARMAQLALAKHWRSANALQRENYTREFQRYLIRSYTATMYLYRNTELEILGNKMNGDDKSTLKVRVKNDQGKAVILYLRLEAKDNTWKIIDINVEGISLIITARNVFDDEINKIGLDAFIANLTKQNNMAAQN